MPRQWRLLGGGYDFVAGAFYTLLNNRSKECLKYGSQTFGINLTFDRSQTLANIKFDLPSGKR